MKIFKLRFNTPIHIGEGLLAERLEKKRDFYSFAAGSVFQNKFEGDIFDVSIKGNHPVWRYAKPLFMAV
jgi:CRISPR-associated protein Csm4